MGGVRYSLDITDADSELRRLEDGPDLHDLARLEAIIVRLFAETQAVVHVNTGALRASGHLHDSSYRSHRWEAAFSYGNAVVDYARAERAKGEDPTDFGTTAAGSRTTQHDFMTPTYGTDHEYLAAILAFLRGEK